MATAFSQQSVFNHVLAIERVQAARDRGSPEEALSIALEAWRHAMAPEIADLIDVLAAEAVALWPAPRVRGNEAFQEAWLGVAAERGPAETAWLASTVSQQVAVKGDRYDMIRPDFVARRFGPLFARLSQLRARAPNPLIAAAATGVVVEAPFTAMLPQWAVAIYQPLLDLIVACQDIRQLPVLEGLLARPRGRSAVARGVLTELIPPVLKSLAAVTVTLDDAGRRAWRALVPAPDVMAGGGALPGVGSAEQSAALLRAVIEHPDDDSPRHAYADLLIGRGDPRGELIAIQLRASGGDAGPEAARRERALLREHGDTWLGDVGRVAAARFGRGFPVKLVLNANAVAPEEMWEGATRHECLRTVEALEKGRGNGEHLTGFLLSAQMGNLRRAEVFRSEDISRLCAGPPRRIEELTFLKPPTKPALKELARTGALPALRQITFCDRNCMSPPPVKNLLDSGLLQRVRVVGVQGRDGGFLRDMQAKLLDPGHVDEIRLDLSELGHAAVRREGATLHAELEDRSDGFAIGELLAARNIATANVRIFHRGPTAGVEAALEAARNAGIRVVVTHVQV